MSDVTLEQLRTLTDAELAQLLAGRETVPEFWETAWEGEVLAHNVWFFIRTHFPYEGRAATGAATFRVLEAAIRHADAIDVHLEDNLDELAARELGEILANWPPGSRPQVGIYQRWGRA